MGDDKNVESIFHAAIEVESDSERASYLDQVCRDDEQLRRQVGELLDAHANAGSFMEDAAQPPTTVDASAILEKPGTVIGKYKLLQQIGEGSFGVVFMAQEHGHLRRKVAVKIVKPGRETRQIVARFKAEERALALMEHPHIAHVFDAGVTNSGRPYFAMELVKGLPITEYCDRYKLSTTERLSLFTDVCGAVHHAHQKGVIHRDLKPSNILVTRDGDQAVAKVIDFGIAKATSQPLTEDTLFTDFEAILGTPLYMSPEQTGYNAEDVDTRADIYSLGVVLYELLTGSTPFDRQRFRQAAIDELFRIIREEDPPKPSTRVSTLGDSSERAVPHAEPESRRLSKYIRGDLDWIVMKSLEKDRRRRYESAVAFGADVERFIQNEPVQARPPSAVYKFSKFAHRNRGFVTAAAFVLIALVGGLVGTTYGLMEAREQEAEARRQEAEAHKQEAIARRHAVREGEARKVAEAAKDRAQRQAKRERRLQYSFAMKAVQQALEDNEPDRVVSILKGQIPREGSDDLRGVEWFWLWKQVKPA